MFDPKWRLEIVVQYFQKYIVKVLCLIFHVDYLLKELNCVVSIKISEVSSLLSSIHMFLSSDV